jgi:hypothetical protein
MSSGVVIGVHYNQQSQPDLLPRWCLLRNIWVTISNSAGKYIYIYLYRFVRMVY